MAMVAMEMATTATTNYPTAATDQQPLNSGVDYATLGETDFRAGRYQEAATDFRHALIDEPNNPRW